MGASDEIYGASISNIQPVKSTNTITTPSIATPRSMTPPTGEKRKSDRKAVEENTSRSNRATPNIDAVDPKRLNTALLKEFEAAGSRDITPSGSPSRKRQRVYGDR